MRNLNNINKLIDDYQKKFISKIDSSSKEKINKLSKHILNKWENNNTIFIIGNGGSGANALHIANDFLYGSGIANKKGINVEALVSNSSVITCLANDVGYDSIFSEQIKVKAKKNDLLIILSGSGNSKNILKAIKIAKKMEVFTFGVIGFDGGEAKKILDDFIHYEIDDMQVVEDLQMFTFHICSKYFSNINFVK